jgi:hypothetical protein
MDKMKLSPNAIRALSAEQAAFPAAQDALDRLAFLVGPVVATAKSDYQITSQRLQDFVSKNFGLFVPNEVAQSLLFRLAKYDFAKQTIVDNSSIFFGVGAEENSNNNTVNELIRDFRLFVEDKSLLPKISDDEILDLFMEKIFELEEFDAPEVTEKKDYDAWKRGLISDYILSKSDEDDNLPPLISKLAELALIRSVVEGMTERKPKLKGRSSLVALLDAPLALYAMGASGSKQKKAFKSTMNAAEEIGVRFAIIPVSIEEIKRVLNGVLTRDRSERTGPTADALRSGEISEPIVSDMKSGPEKYLEKSNIKVLPRNISLFPSEHHFFDETAYEEFSVTASQWTDNTKAQYHDAECLAVTVRARKGANERNVFDNTYSFITLNWKFFRSARRVCLERFSINEQSNPPILHFNDFSASVWVAAGFPTEAKLPERTLLAACERALGGRTGVLQKARSLFEKFQVSDSEHIEAFFQNKDCVDAIVQNTYNDPSLIDDNNVPELFRKVELATAAKVVAEAKEARKKLVIEKDMEIRAAEETGARKLEEVTAQHEADKESWSDELDELKEQFSDFQQSNSDKERARYERIARRAKDVNERVSAKGWGRVDFFEALFFIVASMLGLYAAGRETALAMFFVGAIFVGCSYYEFGWPHRIKHWIIQRYATKQLYGEFSKEEINEWAIKLDANYTISLPEFDATKT